MHFDFQEAAKQAAIAHGRYMLTHPWDWEAWYGWWIGTCRAYLTDPSMYWKGPVLHPVILFWLSQTGPRR